jgi:hypothetical protein
MWLVSSFVLVDSLKIKKELGGGEEREEKEFFYPVISFHYQ